MTLADDDVCNAEIPDAPPDASVFEKADVAVAKAVAPVRKSRFVQAMGTASELSDQPQMRILCAGVIGAGLWRGDKRLVGAGVRMLLAHSIATGIKTAVKHRVDRTRPNVLVDEGRYVMAPGSSGEHDETSFPSGHTAGAVAVAGAFAHDYPEYRTAAYAGAAFMSLMQIPRCKHYPSDVGAGAVIGVAAAGLVNYAADGLADAGSPGDKGSSRAGRLG